MESSTIPISVVMPVYNGSAYLREAIESVLAQTGVEFEFVIGDNVSTDDSVEIIQSYRDPRIRLLRHPKNLGMFGNLNALIAEARHEIIQIFCCDDALLPGCLVRQRDFMLKHPQIAFARCRNTAEHDWWSNPSGFYEAQIPEVVYPAANVLAHVAFGCVVGSLSNAVVRRTPALEVGGFRTDLPYTGDFEFWVRLALAKPMGVHKEELVFVRVHEQQASTLLKKRSDHLWQTDLVMRTLFTRVSAHDLTLCKLHCTFLYACRQFRSAIDVWRGGHRREALKVCTKRTWAYPWPLVLLYFLIGYRFRWGHAFTTKRLLKRIIAQNLPDPSAAGTPS